MHIDPRIAAFPEALRELLDAELAAGNAIVEIASCFPAPPAGAYVKLARPVSTRARESTTALKFYDRNSSIYSGEWTDARRFHFVLEPARPPEPEPDMDAIRARVNTPTSPPPSSEPASLYPSEHDFTPGEREIRERARRKLEEAFRGPARVREFKESMTIDYEKWHDGIGYAVHLIEEATPEERVMIENLLLPLGTPDWRDVEALAVLKTERAERALRSAFEKGNAEIRGAVLRHAPHLVDESRKTAHLVEALRTAKFFGGLSQALDEAETFHPPEVMDTLFRGVLERVGESAAHFAGLLLFLHGKAAAAFDWDQRPFLLRFNTPNRDERVAAFRELCERIAVDPAPYLEPAGNERKQRPRRKKR